LDTARQVDSDGDEDEEEEEEGEEDKGDYAAPRGVPSLR
jgi:hypothetical protein